MVSPTLSNQVQLLHDVYTEAASRRSDEKKPFPKPHDVLKAFETTFHTPHFDAVFKGKEFKNEIQEIEALAQLISTVAQNRAQVEKKALEQFGDIATSLRKWKLFDSLLDSTKETIIAARRGYMDIGNRAINKTGEFFHDLKLGLVNKRYPFTSPEQNYTLAQILKFENAFFHLIERRSMSKQELIQFLDDFEKSLLTMVIQEERPSHAQTRFIGDVQAYIAKQLRPEIDLAPENIDVRTDVVLHPEPLSIGSQPQFHPLPPIPHKKPPSSKKARPSEKERGEDKQQLEEESGKRDTN